MDISIGTHSICDFHLAVFCEHSRATFYNEPFHMCYYHGVETDLVNLTTYIGYELWKVSTTCGLFLETVRATGVIFFLGVGSLVCYKLYGYYRKKRPFGKFKDEKNILRRQQSISRWVSRELLDSCLNREPELGDINKEYFGPVDYSDDDPSSSCSERAGFATSSFSTNSHSLKKRVKEKKVVGSDSRKMGHSHSTNNKSIVYNVCTGVNFIDSISPITSKSPKDSSFGISGQSISTIYNENYSFNNKSARHKPLGLPPSHRRRKKAKLNRSDEVDHIFTMSTSSRDSRKSVESIISYDTDDDSSSKLDSDEEMLNLDGDDEDDDGGELVRCKKKQSESLVGNYSLQSLWDRHQENESLDVSLQPQSNKCLPVFVRHSSSRSVSISDEEAVAEEDSLSLGADLSPISGLISCSRTSLCRDNSFGTISEVSEISVDVTGFNNVGKQTEVRIDEIQKEIDDVKKDCIDMESHFGTMNAHGPTPTMYTELVKPCLSDISEGSDLSGEEKPSSDHSSLRRYVFKQRLQTSSHSDASVESSAATDLSNNTNSNSSANPSANLSLEWDSMKSSEENVTNVKIPTPKVGNVGKSGDSGSDFGTPLTNCSPEPAASKSGIERTASLEWDEEFPSLHSKCAATVNNNKIQSFEEEKAKLLTTQPALYLTLNLNNEVQNSKNMWSSMESGYIDEFTESGVSCLVTPLTEDKSDKSCTKVKFCEREKQAQNIRTWPVVGEKLPTKQLCSLFQANNSFIRICHHLQIKNFRPLHVDKYCVFRAVLLQMLIQGFSPLEQSGGIDHVKKTFSKWARCNYRWLALWSSSNRKTINEDNNFRSIMECLQCLNWMTGVVLSSTNFESAAVKIFNSDPEVDVQVVEAAKLLMLKTAIDLYESISLDKAVPIFALRLFSRETSPNPEALMHNHLNHLGCCLHISAMELFLLGYALGVTICVITPGDKINDDLMKYYPDCQLGSWPEIYLAKSEITGQFCLTSR